MINSTDFTVFNGNSGYSHVDTRSIGPRTICKFLLTDNGSVSLTNAVKTIRTLLLQNPHLCPVFPMTSEVVLRLEIQKNKYLTINGDAVCLAPKKDDQGHAKYKDKYFSETFLEEPIRCSQGHHLEKKCVQLWTAMKKDVCPAGFHVIGPLTVDEDLLDEIKQFKTEQKEAQRREEEFIDKQRAQDLSLIALQVKQHQQHNELSLLSNRKLDPIPLFGDAGKLIIKMGGKKICLTVAKKTMEEGGKEFGKQVVKKIPVVSFIIGIFFGIYRATQGEYVKAVGEIASGTLACVPGWGTGASVILDVAMGIHDVSQALPGNEETPPLTLSLAQAYEILGINPVSNPTKAEVDHKYREQALSIHPDKLQKFGDYYVQNAGAMTQLLNDAKGVIYKERHWA